MEFIAPILCVLFGAAFVLLAPASRHLRHLGYFGIAFLLVGIGLFMDIRGYAGNEGPASFLNDLLYVVAALLLAQGVTRRSDRPFPPWLHAAAFLIMASGLAWYSFIDPKVVARVYLLEFGFGIVLIAAASRIRKSTGYSLTDCIVYITVLVAGLHFFPRTLLTAYTYSGPGAGYEQTSFWIALSLSVAILVSLGGVALVVAAGLDTIEALKLERDQDPLTGLPNRRAFNESAARIIDRHGTVTLIMIDLDYFKRINDRFGHGVGDQVLAEFAGLLQASVRKGEIAGRFGGEEFLIVLPDDLDAASELAELIRDRLATHRFTALPDDYQLTASFGIARIDAESGIGKAIDRADAMLYSSKAEGRNRIRIEHGAEIIRLQEQSIRKIS